MRHSIWLALLLLFIYIISYAGVFHSIDELATLSLTESLVHGSLQVNRMEWEQIRSPPQNAYGDNENLYSKKGLAASVVVLPFFVVGKVWPGVGAVQLTFLAMALVSALTTLVFYHLALALGYGEKASTVATLALGVGTLLWPYAKMLFSEPIAAFGICLALLGIVKTLHEGRYRWLWVCSLGLSIVVLTRSANVVLVLPFVGVVAYKLLIDFRQERPWKALLEDSIAFSLPLGASILITGIYNVVRFNSYFSYPLVPGEAFTTPLSTGVAGLLWSSGKGLFFYVPLTSMALLSYVVARRKMVRPGYLVALAVIVTTLLYFGRWYDWPGGKAWGPRFLVPTMPAVMMLCLPALQWLGRRERPTWIRYVLAGWLGLTVLAQLPGILINFEAQENLDGVPFQNLVWQWHYSPLLTNWSKIFTGAQDPIWFHSFFWSNAPWLLVLIASLVGAIPALFLWHGNRLRHGSQSQPPTPYLVLLALMITGLGIAFVFASRSDPRWWEQSDTFAANQTAREWISHQYVPGDAVLLDLKNEYDTWGRVIEWLNFGPLYPDYIGWLRKSSLTATDEERLSQWLGTYGRVWLSLQATAENDPESTTENWLRRWAYEGQNHWIDTQRIVEYVLPAESGDLLVSGTAFWSVANGVEMTYNLRHGYTTNHFLIDLYWQDSVGSDLKFSVQALDTQLHLIQQVDRPPATAGHPNRVGMYVTEPNVTLILKLYNETTGEVYPTQLLDSSPAEFVTLNEIP
jgi:hypothetical protein